MSCTVESGVINCHIKIRFSPGPPRLPATFLPWPSSITGFDSPLAFSIPVNSRFDSPLAFSIPARFPYRFSPVILPCPFRFPKTQTMDNVYKPLCGVVIFGQELLKVAKTTRSTDSTAPPPPVAASGQHHGCSRGTQNPARRPRVNIGGPLEPWAWGLFGRCGGKSQGWFGS